MVRHRVFGSGRLYCTLDVTLRRWLMTWRVSHAHWQLENLPSLQEYLVEAVNRRSVMIVGDGQMESVSCPQAGFGPPEILPGETEIVSARKEDGKRCVHHCLKTGIGPYRRFSVEAIHANFPGDQRRKLNHGPMTDSERLGGQRGKKCCNLFTGRFRKNKRTKKLVSK
jgi:hypothetical protein